VRLLIPLLLACLAAVFISATTPVSARDQVPFRAGCGTEVEIEFVYPIHLHTVTGQGNATHLRATSAVTDNQIVNVETGLHVDWGQCRDGCIGDELLGHFVA
jgi:hypothetical protein